MRAYGVVRKSPQKIIEHIIKLPTINPHISIDPIKSNQSQIIQRDHKEIPQHLLEKTNIQFIISNNRNSEDRRSRSVSQRRSIFKFLNSSLSQEKSRQSRYSREEEGMALPIILQSGPKSTKEEDQKEDLKNLKLSTPQKNVPQYEVQTPFKRLSEQDQKQFKTPAFYRRTHRLFEQDPLKLMKKRQTVEVPNIRVGGTPQTESKRMSNFSQHEQSANQRSQLYESNYSDRTASVIVIGCCPQQSYDHSSIMSREQDAISEHSSVVNIGCCGQVLDVPDRQQIPTSKQSAQKPTQIHRNFNIAQNVSEQFVPERSFDQPRPFYKQIFNEFNPELLSNRIKKSLEQEETKTFSRQAPQSEELIPPPRQKVKIFKIAPLRPFEF